VLTDLCGLTVSVQLLELVEQRYIITRIAFPIIYIGLAVYKYVVVHFSLHVDMKVMTSDGWIHVGIGNTIFGRSSPYSYEERGPPILHVLGLERDTGIGLPGKTVGVIHIEKNVCFHRQSTGEDDEEKNTG